MRSRRTVGMLLVVALLVGVGSPAAAWAAFSLQLGPPNGFAVTLNGLDQTASWSLPLRVTATDKGAAGNQGWLLTITSTQFATASATQLPVNASTVASVAVSCAQAPCTDPVNSVAYPVQIPAASTAPSAVRFFNAAAGTGKGTFDLTVAAQTAVPANADAGSYTSTVIVSLISGP